MSASWIAVKKLSGVAVPSCSCGSSQRDANPACQASVILPLAAALTGVETGTTVATTAVTISATASQGNTLRDTSRESLMSRTSIRGVVPAKECRRLTRRVDTGQVTAGLAGKLKILAGSW